jgi:SPW repeat
MSKWRWQDYVNVLIGVWIAASPWVLGFSDTQPVVAWNAVILGLAIALIAALDLEILSRFEEWLLVALGAWSLASPWVLGFAALREAAVSMVIAGGAVMVLTLWEIVAGMRWGRTRDPAHGQ